MARYVAVMCGAPVGYGSTGFGKPGFVSATDVGPNMKDTQSTFFLKIGAEINQWNSPSLR